MAAKKGLGRGLSALIPDDDMEFLSRVARGDELLATAAPQDGVRQPAREPARALAEHATPTPGAAPGVTPADAGPANEQHTPGIVRLQADSIEANPFQPRRSFGEADMAELVDSIRAHGILQPILVRPMPGEASRYQLVAGERRWRAALAAGLGLVPAVVREVDDQQALELALIENVQRHDITPVDAALAYRRLAQEFALSQEEIARRVGKSRSAVANTLRLLDLPEEVQKAIDEGALTEGHGRAVLLAPTDGARRAVFRHILRHGLSVREAETIARRAAEAGRDGATAKSKSGTGASLDPDLQQVEAALQRALATRVRIQPKSARSKSGRIVIEYYSDEDLNRVLDALVPRPQ